MSVWWIGNAVLLGVVAPGAVLLLRGVLDAARTVRRTAGDVAAVGDAIAIDLGPVWQLRETERHVRQTTADLARYGAAVDDIL